MFIQTAINLDLSRVISIAGEKEGSRVFSFVLDFCAFESVRTSKEQIVTEAIEKVKKAMEIPLTDVPLHINDPAPVDAIMAWRLKNAL